MTAEQVVHSFLTTFETQGPDAAWPYLAETMTLRSTTPPLDQDREGFTALGAIIQATLPDFRWNVQSLATHGSRITVTMRWTGTQTGVFPLGAFVPGARDIPPSGKRLSVPDTFIFTVKGDQITDVEIASGPGEGLMEMLRQLGVQLPPQ